MSSASSPNGGAGTPVPGDVLSQMALSRSSLKPKEVQGVNKAQQWEGVKARSAEVLGKAPVHLKWSGFYFSFREEQQPWSWECREGPVAGGSQPAALPAIRFLRKAPRAPALAFQPLALISLEEMEM